MSLGNLLHRNCSHQSIKHRHQFEHRFIRAAAGDDQIVNGFSLKMMRQLLDNHFLENSLASIQTPMMGEKIISYPEFTRSNFLESTLIHTVPGVSSSIVKNVSKHGEKIKSNKLAKDKYKYFSDFSPRKIEIDIILLNLYSRFSLFDMEYTTCYRTTEKISVLIDEHRRRGKDIERGSFTVEKNPGTDEYYMRFRINSLEGLVMKIPNLLKICDLDSNKSIKFRPLYLLAGSHPENFELGYLTLGEFGFFLREGWFAPCSSEEQIAVEYGVI